MRGWVVCTFQYLTMNDSSDLFSFFKKGHFWPLLFFCIFSMQLTVNVLSLKYRRWLDSSRGSLVLEATALPTEPQPLPLLFGGQLSRGRKQQIAYTIWTHNFSVMSTTATAAQPAIAVLNKICIILTWWLFTSKCNQVKCFQIDKKREH